MSWIDAADGTPRRFCTLIPTRGRADQLAKSLKKMPWLDHSDTFILIERQEAAAYAAVRRQYPSISWKMEFENPTGSVAVAREWLRTYASRYAVAPAIYSHAVVTDDNAIHASEAALHNLVRATVDYPAQPVIMAGMHNTAEHFDRGKLGKQVTVHGLRSYPAVAMIFQCYPMSLYTKYRYPADAYGLDDRHFFLWCIDHGVKDFRVCMDAPFTKSRYQAGGQGTIQQRMTKNGHAIARLALDFPRLVGATGTLRIPWQFLLEMQAGATDADRLPGGAMRKEGALFRTPVPGQRPPHPGGYRVSRARKGVS